MNKYESIYKANYQSVSLAISRAALKSEYPQDALYWKSVFLGTGHSPKHLKLYYLGTHYTQHVMVKKEFPFKYPKFIAKFRAENKLPLP